MGQAANRNAEVILEPSLTRCSTGSRLIVLHKSGGGDGAQGERLRYWHFTPKAFYNKAQSRSALWVASPPDANPRWFLTT
jgi:hypothetical protein